MKNDVLLKALWFQILLLRNEDITQEEFDIQTQELERQNKTILQSFDYTNELK